MTSFNSPSTLLQLSFDSPFDSPSTLLSLLFFFNVMFYGLPTTHSTTSTLTPLHSFPPPLHFTPPLHPSTSPLHFTTSPLHFTTSGLEDVDVMFPWYSGFKGTVELINQGATKVAKRKRQADGTVEIVFCTIYYLLSTCCLFLFLSLILFSSFSLLFFFSFLLSYQKQKKQKKVLSVTSFAFKETTNGWTRRSIVRATRLGIQFT